MWYRSVAVALLAARSALAVIEEGVLSTYPDAVSDNPITIAGSKSNQSSPPKYPSPWGRGTGDWAAAYEKARAFVSQLTLLEKVNLTTGVGWESERCVGEVGSIPRLGFRGLCMQDSPVGVRDTDYNSVFPAGVNVAATWDRDLAYARGAAMGEEHAGKGVDVQLGPVAGPLGRSAAGGRNWEGFSPDPVLTGILIAETVKGIQSSGVIACAKHFIGNEQEHFRQVSESQGYGENITESISANLDDQTLHELYLWPFADAVRAGVGSIMCSYNQVNNSYACANSYLLNYILKNELDFQGFVMSDWGAQHSGVSSTLAGMDMSMPGDTAFDTGYSFWGTNLTLAVVNGTVPEWRIDDMATRIMAAFYYVGRDETQEDINFSSWTLDTYGYKNYYASQDYSLINEHVDVRAEHAKVIREVGARSIVLLKNNGALPLTGNEKFTAVLGSDAGPNLYGPNGCSDRGCDNGTLAMAWGSGSANFATLITPDFAIQSEVLQNGGVYQAVLDDYAYSQVADVAAQASVCLTFINSDSGEGYLYPDGNEGDRLNLTAWHAGDALVKNVTANCNNTIVIIHSTGPILMNEWNDNENVTAIVWAGIPGDQSGFSLADVLYGRVNPGGKLPFTVGSTRKEYGTDIMYNVEASIPQLNFTEGVFIDYRSFDKQNITPVYEFGYGISYTTFNYSSLQVSKANSSAYTPTTGSTGDAPVLGNYSTDLSAYLFPSNLSAVPYYIYPYVNSTDAEAASLDPYYGESDSAYLPANTKNGTSQPLLPAGGAPGGNPSLYDILYTITATVTNTGNLAGEEVPQLYISLGGPYDPKVALRGFERLSIEAGKSATFTADLTRRDISNWDPVSQDWVVSNYTKTVYVGASSRKLYLSAVLS